MRALVQPPKKILIGGQKNWMKENFFPCVTTTQIPKKKNSLSFLSNSERKQKERA